MYFPFSTYILQGMSFKPNKEDFEEGMKGVVRKLEETMLCIKVNHGNPQTFLKQRRSLITSLMLAATGSGPCLLPLHPASSVRKTGGARV
jgi:hypothetical protein